MLTGQQKLERLERALAYGGNTHTVLDVIERCEDGRAQIWENQDGCIVTEIERFPLVSAVRYWTISGNLPDCLALDERISKWAISQGCTIGFASGRKGWLRAGAPYGWRLHGYNFFKELAS